MYKLKNGSCIDFHEYCLNAIYFPIAYIEAVSILFFLFFFLKKTSFKCRGLTQLQDVRDRGGLLQDVLGFDPAVLRAGLLRQPGGQALAGDVPDDPRHRHARHLRFQLAARTGATLKHQTRAGCPIFLDWIFFYEIRMNEPA